MLSKLSATAYSRVARRYTSPSETHRDDSTKWFAATCSYSHARSEEHTSELQSQSNLVCRLLLEKKNRHAGGHRRRHLVSAPPPAGRRRCRTGRPARAARTPLPPTLYPRPGRRGPTPSYPAPPAP